MFAHNDDLYLSHRGEYVLWARHSDGVIQIQIDNNLPTTTSADLTSLKPPLSTTKAEASFASYDEFHHAVGHLIVTNPTRIYLDGDLVPPKPKDFDCTTCHLSKSVHHRPVAPADRRTSQPFEIIHSDLSGKFSRRSLGGARYYISFIDECTRYTWVKFLKTKSEAPQAIKDFLAYVKTQHKASTKRFIADGGGKYISSALKVWFREQGIDNDPTPPYAHELNGVPERFNRTVVQIARCMVLSDDLLPLWAEAIQTATFVKNITPHAADKLKRTPYECLLHKKPSIKHLHPFGIEAYVHIPKEARQPGSKLLHRAEQGIFVGYGRNTKTFRIYVPARHVIVESRDVTFKPFGIKQYFTGVLEGSDDDDVAVVDSRPVSNRQIKPDPAASGDQQQPDDRRSNLTSNVRHDMPPPSSPTLRGGRSAAPRGSISSPRPRGSTRQLPTSQRGSPRPSTRGSSSRDTSVQSDDSAGVTTRSGRVVKQTDKAKGLMSIYDPPEEPTLAPLEPPNYFAYTTIIDESIPRTYAEATTETNAPLWRPAIDHQIKALQDNRTWELLNYDDLPTGAKLVGTRWVFDIKRDETGRTVKRKGRIVAQGFSQRPGINFTDTYSPVVRYDSLRLIIMISVIKGWPLRQVDFDAAYLNGRLKETIYARCPPGVSKVGQIIRFLKTIYGLKQSGREWYEVLITWLKLQGLTQAAFDPCVFYSTNLIMGIYVDDVLLTGLTAEMSTFIRAVSDRFKFKDLGRPKLLLGLELDYHDRQIRLHQRTYASAILRRYGMQACNGRSTPLDPNNFPPRSTEAAELSRQRLFQSINRSINFLAICSRPTLSYTVSMLGSYNSNPSELHLKLAYQVLRYIQKTLDSYIEIEDPPPAIPIAVTMFSDASYGTDPDNGKSFSGYILKVNGCTLAWSSKRQSCVARSTCESEYMAASHAASHLVWTKQALSELLPSGPTSYRLLVDNEPAMSLIRDRKVNQRSKHINVHYHFVREQYLDGAYKLGHVGSADNLADVCTKALPKPALEEAYRRIMGNWDF